jgi:conjugal transfer pilus assembly protein TraE
LLVVLVFFRNERVVIAPPHVSQEYWVESSRVSASYLEEMALFYAFLLLDTSPANASFKRDMILKESVPHAYGSLKAKLLEDENRIKKDNVTTSFQASEVRVDPNTMSVELTGDLVRYVGEKRISQSRDTYQLQMSYHHGRLMIEEFQLIRSDKNE